LPTGIPLNKKWRNVTTEDPSGLLVDENLDALYIPEDCSSAHLSSCLCTTISVVAWIAVTMLFLLCSVFIDFDDFDKSS